ncbi:TIR domain-containing protein [Butyrivibrio sp. VCB2001]|uniref:TIR domain-containing protein n=1 Tax=Butyrivibrio sp. VCB2001 TaxID=1280667 RepID=UPI000404E90E|nr:TIR domain-containing protein [Butyrivibrio sp. VCB2001]
MINHFNAFISYKHADLDNKIAASIVKDLERFHIPKKIQKATGVKKIERIFRDKDELPITSDLGDTISQALENSDFLIVICSHNTKLSTWVEREIEYFLQSHPINRILTVLCDGEPNEVIPQILLKGKDIFVDENGVEHIREIPYEPLSCDYRLPYRKAKAEELPRLAAALIGCSYDELINRRRQYKMRRMNAIFAGALTLTLGFIAYMMHSNALIQKNYLESLKNQSRYLANESEIKLNNANRIEAMQLALASLPEGDEDVRPVIPEAERAITKASYSYVSLEGSNIGAVWNYRMPGRVKSFKLSDEGSYFAAMDQNGVVMAWKTDVSHELVLYEDNAADKGTGFFFLGDDRLILLCQGSVSAFDLNESKLLWKIEDEQSKQLFVDDVFVLPEGDLLLPGAKGNVDIVSADDGKLKRTFSLFGDESNMIDATDFVMSEDGTKLIYILANKTDINNYIYSLHEYDLSTGEQLVNDEIGSWVTSIVSAGDNIYLACKEDMDGSSVQLMNFRFVTEDKAEIKCISIEDLSEKWASEITATDVYFNAEFLPLAGGKIAYYESDTCRIWDVETGEILGTYNTNDSIIDISDNDGDGEPMFITKGGATAAPATFGDKQGVSVFDRFTDNLSDALVGGGVYTLSDNARQVIYYGTKVYDEEWKLIDEVPDFKTGNTYLLTEDVLAILDDEGEGAKIIFVDPAEKTYMGQCVLSEDIPSYSYRLIGSNNSTFYAAVSKGLVLRIVKVNLSDMTLEEEVINEDYSKYEPYCFLKNGKLVYINSGEGFEYTIVQRDLATGEEKKVEFNTAFSDVYYIEEIDSVYINADTDLLADMSKETITEIDLGEGFGDAVLASANSDGSIIAVSDSEIIKLIGRDGEIIGEIFCGGVAPMDITFIDADGKEIIVVAYTNGTLYRYDKETFEFLGKSDLSVIGSSFVSNKYFDYDSEKGLLYFKNSDITDVVETDTWVEVTCIYNSFGHDKKTDTFLTYGYDQKSTEGVVGYFKHYSVDDLIQKTKDYLHGEEMSVEQKSIYGITG